MRNFTLIDTLGILKACLALFPFMLAPGYVAGWALNLFEFRRRRPILRLILALPLTIAICPMPSYLLARFCESGALGVLYHCVRRLRAAFGREVRRVRLRRSFKIHLGCSGPDRPMGEWSPSGRW